MVNSAGQFSGNYGNGKGRAMKGDKMGKSMSKAEAMSKGAAIAKGKKAKMLKAKPKKRMAAPKMAEPMSDMDFGVR